MSDDDVPHDEPDQADQADQAEDLAGDQVPDDYEPFEHPVNPRTMVVLIVLVVLVAAAVLIAVTLARR